MSIAATTRRAGSAVAAPRPRATVGGVLLVVGAALAVVGSITTWYSMPGLDVDGFTIVGDGRRDGPIVVGVAAVLGAAGALTFGARRILLVGVVAVVVATFGLVTAVADYVDVRRFVDDYRGRAGPGLPIVAVGALIALVGGLNVVARRRR